MIHNTFFLTAQVLETVAERIVRIAYGIQTKVNTLAAEPLPHTKVSRER